MAHTFAEKVLARAAGLSGVVPAQIVTVRPDHLLTHDNTSAIVGKIEKDLEKYGLVSNELPGDRARPRHPGVATRRPRRGHKKVREFVTKYGVRHFFDVGDGVCHQVVVEKGLALPGRDARGQRLAHVHVRRGERVRDGHRPDGGRRAPSHRRDLAQGARRPSRSRSRASSSRRVSAKDLVLTIIGDLGADGANYDAVEFHGDVASLSVDDRFVIANMGVEMGAKIAVVPVRRGDREVSRGRGRPAAAYEPVWADAGRLVRVRAHVRPRRRSCRWSRSRTRWTT